MFSKGHLFTLEQKSTKDKSISFSEKIIKKHQIENLLKADTYDDVISGFLFNFREPENKVYFVPIKDFVAYKNVAENEIKDHTYKSKVNKSSIPISICEEVGIEIAWRKKTKRYHYHLREFIEQAIQHNK
nr:Holliday junction resolvase RecU [Mycobacterium sp. E3298]